MRDFIRETVLKTVRRHWGAGSCQMKKHSTRDEVVEEIIAKVIMRMIRHPPLLKSLLEKGRLLPYVIKCAENHVRDAHRWQGSRQRGIGYQQPMQPGELRNAVLEEYVERREACEQTLKKARGILGAKRYSDLLTHVRFGSHASKQEGTTDGQLSHTRRFLREAFAELDTEEVN